MLGAAIGVRLSRTPIPTAMLRRKVFRMLYGGKYAALDEQELEKPLEEFRSINELFTRGVRAGLRPLPERMDQMLSPVDGTVQDAGRLQHDTVLTIKGIRYSLSSLVPETDTQPFHNGHFAILFLSPRDCHRVFSPAPAQITRTIHVPGHRLLVHPTFQSQQFPVFALNERKIMQLETPLGKCLLIMVAGWGVGNITHPFRMPRCFSPRRVSVATLEPPRPVNRAEWIATFELGSTVIMITEQQQTGQPLVQRDQMIRSGQPLFDSLSGCNLNGVVGISK